MRVASILYMFQYIIIEDCIELNVPPALNPKGYGRARVLEASGIIIEWLLVKDPPFPLSLLSLRNVLYL